jgi:hypothetical protein
MWSPPSLPDYVLWLLGAPPWGATAFIGWWRTNRHMQRRLALAATSTIGGWTCRPVKWRLGGEPPFPLAAAPTPFARGGWLPPFRDHVTTAVWNGGYRTCRRLKRRQDPATISNSGSRLALKKFQMTLFSEKRRKNIYKKLLGGGISGPVLWRRRRRMSVVIGRRRPAPTHKRYRTDACYRKSFSFVQSTSLVAFLNFLALTRRQIREGRMVSLVANSGHGYDLWSTSTLLDISFFSNPVIRLLLAKWQECTKDHQLPSPVTRKT